MTNPAPLVAAVLMALAAGCENPTVVTGVPRDSSVRFSNEYQSTPPVCENHDVEHVEPGIRVTCLWSCKGYWTPLRGAGRYDVARTWVWDAANTYYEPSSYNAQVGANTYPFWSTPCEPMPVTGCPDCEY